jgi:hypothetical protein
MTSSARAAISSGASWRVRCPRPAAPPPCALGEDFESENPQNVAPPERTPSPALQPDAAVRVQLEAAARNDTPRVDHGVHTLYDFCADAGDMDRSRYFGHVRNALLFVRSAACADAPLTPAQSKDLYHLDHFLGIKATYPELFRNDGFEVGSPAAAAGPDGLVDVRATVRAGGSDREFVCACPRSRNAA